MPVNDKIFNNIKIHTQYSICEGALKIDDLANYCKSNKSCDHNQLGEFKCKDCDDILQKNCFKAHFRFRMLLH